MVMRSTNVKDLHITIKKNVFVLACINGDGTKQNLYELNPDTFEIVGTYKFSDPDKMGQL